MKITQLLNQIRDLIGKCTDGEREMYEELVAEAEGWKMRLDELEDEADEDE